MKQYLLTQQEIEALKSIQHKIHQANLEAGWWNNQTAGVVKEKATKLCLIHSEVSEALEAVRKSKNDSHLPDRPGDEVELADAIIRAFDYAGGYKLDIAGALAEKFAYNMTREDHKKEVREAAGGKAI